MKDHLTLDELGAALGGRVESISPIGVSMQIDRAFLEGEIANLQKQRANAAMVLHQADGAIHAYQALIKRLDTVEEPKEPPGQLDEVP